MKRLNITLPDDMAIQLATKQNKSHYIAEALKEKLNRERGKQIKQLLFEGYSATAKEDAKLHTDWEIVEPEGWE